MASSTIIQDSPAGNSSPATRAVAVTPVAVIGLACRLPGGIDSPERLWEALLRGDDLVTDVPAERWDPDDYDESETGRSAARWGAFLDDVAGFDFEFFGIDEREAIASDPQHRVLLETSWEAMEHAGLTPQTLADSLTGVFVGLTHADYQLLGTDGDTAGGAYGFSGSSFSMASGRIAYALGAHGPALTVDTACSSGLTAVHLACRSLHEHETDLAFAGGAALILDPRKWTCGTAEGMLSPTGRCRAFDVAEDGFVPGEGCVVVLLKRLPDAQRDGDRILAVIRGTAANQSGHTVNISTPSQPAEVATFRNALAAADVDATSVGMVETHGTGSPTGDGIEYASLAEVYGLDGPCALAAVKTNFGHTQSASGALGLAKTVLALQHGVIPRNLHFTRLPDAMAQIESDLFVPQDNTPWPARDHAPRRAAVSSYGMSGTNVHAILEQAPDTPTDAHQPGDLEPSATTPWLFPLSSTSVEELRRTADRLADWLEAHEDVALPDLAYTLACRRAHRPVRTGVVAETRLQLTEALRDIAGGDTPYRAAVGCDDRSPVWVFSGEGSQWAAMGAALLATEPVFAATVAHIEPLIAHEAGFSVTDAMSAPKLPTGHDRLQPTLFTMQLGLAAVMKAHGVRPGAVIGYSLGEIAAAVVAGALSLDDGVRVVCRRSQLMSRIADGGATARVGLPAKQVLSELTSRGITDVVVAVVEAPESTVIAGAAETVRELMGAWAQREVAVDEIPGGDVALHSPHVDPILDELAGALTDLNPMAPEVPFYSTTLFDPREQLVCDADYWVTNTRRMVRFATAVQAALDDGHRVFAELAPEPLLADAVEHIGRSRDMPLAVLAAMHRSQALPFGLRSFVADLHDAGAAIDFAVHYPDGRLVDAPLPTWTHRRLWLSDDRREATTRGGNTVSVHPLLGPHVCLPGDPARHLWQAELGTAGHAWLGDGPIHDAAVVPGSVFCEMALAGARTVLGEAAEIHDLRFGAPLPLAEQAAAGATAVVSAPGIAEFTVETIQDSKRTRHCTATLHIAVDEQPAAHDTAALRAEYAGRGDRGDGPVGGVLTEITLPRAIRSRQGDHVVHPALLDACFQSVETHPDTGEVGADLRGSALGVRRLRVYGPARNARYCYTRVASTTAGMAAGIEADIDVLDEHGSVLLTVEGLQFAVESEQDRRDRAFAQGLLSVDWQQRALPAVEDTDAGTWLLIHTSSNEDMMATALPDALKLQGAQCIPLSWPLASDHDRNREQLANQLRTRGFAGVVILAGPPHDAAEAQSPLQGLEQVRHLQRIARELPQIRGELPRLFIVTRTAHRVLPGETPNLQQAGLRGLIRKLGAEFPLLGATQIDIDEATDAEQLAQQLVSGSDEDETAWRNGHWYTARVYPAALRPEERRTTTIHPEHEGMCQQIRIPGDLESLELVACYRVPPGPGQIEVAISTSGVTFADVLIAFGRHSDADGGPPQLGIDFAGVVTAVGPGVTDLNVGDHVGGLSPDGCWTTFVTCTAETVVALPPGLADDQAAAVTTAYATAWHGLTDLARITADDTVLIHPATGEVGHAAIAVARATGAKIFATAGSERDRQLLRDVGVDHVYDSHGVGFADRIRHDTAGYGVDIVLNSAIGPAQRAGFELLSPGGRFVEIGEHAIDGGPASGLVPLRRNLALHDFDLRLLAVNRPARVGELLKTVYRLVADGVLPIPDITHYPLADAATALRQLNAGEHTTKVVLDIPHTGRADAVLPPPQVQVFRRDGSYIISDGVGGLGLFFAQKLAAAGCGRIVLTSRAQPDGSALEAVEQIRELGIDVVVECGETADPRTADRAVAAATAGGLPVRGVLHSADAAAQATLTDITDELIDRDWASTVDGAWNLHTATVGQPLDWFCSFSSVAALVGSPGQGATAAGDSWLDGFTRWRRAQNLPATTIAWGDWAALQPSALPAPSGAGAIAPEEGAYAFEALLRHDRACVGYAPTSGTPWLNTRTGRRPFLESLRSASPNTTGSEKLRAELGGINRQEWPAVLRQLISDQVGTIMRQSIDPDRTLFEYGLDSLGAMELRTRIETETGARIAVTDITTIHELAKLLCEKLQLADSA